MMKTFIHMQHKEPPILPSKFIEDGRMDFGLVEYLINSYSNIGDLVFDPFAGYGTTLLLAHRLNRIPFGFEKNPDKFSYCIDLLNPNCQIINDDFMNHMSSKYPEMDLCITSPTYAWKNVGCNPFTGNTTNYYDEYLDCIYKYFSHLSQFMKNNGHIIVEVSNIEWNDQVTPMAWDIGKTISVIPNLRFCKELIVTWESENTGFGGGTYGFGYDHSYCLIYKKEGASKCQ